MARPLLASCLVVSLAAGTACSELPDRVDRLTLVNGTEYDIDVQIGDADRTGWLPLGRAAAESERDFEGVLDQGAVWVFGFNHEGDRVGELSLERSELERDGWRVEIPEEIGDRLRRGETGPSP